MAVERSEGDQGLLDSATTRVQENIDLIENANAVAERASPDVGLLHGCINDLKLARQITQMECDQLSYWSRQIKAKGLAPSDELCRFKWDPRNSTVFNAVYSLLPSQAYEVKPWQLAEEGRIAVSAAAVDIFGFPGPMRIERSNGTSD